MHSRDYRDIIAGMALLAIGLFAAFYGMNTMRLGSIAQIGPGLFPVTLSFILCGFGVAIGLPALFRTGNLPDIDLRSFAAVSISILAFGLLVRPFGLLPAIVVLTSIASLADGKLAFWKAALLGVGLALFAILIFRFGLGLQVRIIAWPW